MAFLGLVCLLLFLCSPPFLPFLPSCRDQRPSCSPLRPDAENKHLGDIQGKWGCGVWGKWAGERKHRESTHLDPKLLERHHAVGIRHAMGSSDRLTVSDVELHVLIPYVYVVDRVACRRVVVHLTGGEEGAGGPRPIYVT